MILFFDTETTGKVDFRMPPDADCQPGNVRWATQQQQSENRVYHARH